MYLDDQKFDYEELVNLFISEGPTAVKVMMGVSEANWRLLFDELVFDHNLLYKCVLNNAEFFVDLFVNYGEKHIRYVLDVYDVKYDLVWQLVFDLLAVSFDALYLHVLEHRDKYILALKVRGGDFLRVLLGIGAERYEGVWESILNLLHSVVCDGIFTELNLERGIEGFSRLVNQSREHRALVRYR